MSGEPRGPDARRELPLIFVGVPDAGSRGDAENLAPLVTAFAVRYPMGLDEEGPDGYRVVRVETEEDLVAWAERNFPDYDVK